MEINMLITTHNRCSILKRTLISFLNVDFPESFGSLYVIENGGYFGVKKLVESFASDRIRYRYHEIGNKSESLNRYINEFSDDTFLLFCDDDVRFEKDFLLTYSSCLKEYHWNDKCYFGGAFGVDYEKKPSELYRRYLPESAKGVSEDYFLQSGTSWFPGINWGCFKSVFPVVGGFNHQLGPGSARRARGQESEFQERLYKNGYEPILVKKSFLYHYVPRTCSSFYWLIKRTYFSGVGDGIISIDRTINYYLGKFWSTLLRFLYLLVIVLFCRRKFHKTMKQGINTIYYLGCLIGRLK